MLGFPQWIILNSTSLPDLFTGQDVYFSWRKEKQYMFYESGMRTKYGKPKENPKMNSSCLGKRTWLLYPSIPLMWRSFVFVKCYTCSKLLQIAVQPLLCLTVAGSCHQSCSAQHGPKPADTLAGSQLPNHSHLRYNALTFCPQSVPASPKKGTDFMHRLCYTLAWCRSCGYTGYLKQLQAPMFRLPWPLKAVGLLRQLKSGHFYFSVFQGGSLPTFLVICNLLALCGEILLTINNSME